METRSKTIHKDKATAFNRNPAKQRWLLRLYVAGETPRSASAIATAQKLCEKELNEQYKLQVVNLFKESEIDQEDHIAQVTSMLSKLPPPLARILKDLHRKERVLIGVELRRWTDE